MRFTRSFKESKTFVELEESPFRQKSVSTKVQTFVFVFVKRMDNLWNVANLEWVVFEQISFESNSPVDNAENDLSVVLINPLYQLSVVDEIEQENEVGQFHEERPISIENISLYDWWKFCCAIPRRQWEIFFEDLLDHVIFEEWRERARQGPGCVGICFPVFSTERRDEASLSTLFELYKNFQSGSGGPRYRWSVLAERGSELIMLHATRKMNRDFDELDSDTRLAAIGKSLAWVDEILTRVVQSVDSSTSQSSSSSVLQSFSIEPPPSVHAYLCLIPIVDADRRVSFFGTASDYLQYVCRLHTDTRERERFTSPALRNLHALSHLYDTLISRFFSRRN